MDGTFLGRIDNKKLNQIYNSIRKGFEGLPMMPKKEAMEFFELLVEFFKTRLTVKILKTIYTDTHSKEFNRDKYLIESTWY